MVATAAIDLLTDGALFDVEKVEKRYIEKILEELKKPQVLVDIKEKEKMELTLKAVSRNREYLAMAGMAVCALLAATPIGAIGAAGCALVVMGVAEMTR